MGCDIHMFVEVRDNLGNWSKVGNVFKSRYSFREELIDEPYEERDYGFFALLAGVRNYHNIEAMFPCRGLPGDISIELKAISDDWGGDVHSHSHACLWELWDINFNNKWFDEYTIPELRKLGSAHHVRIVFWFDN